MVRDDFAIFILSHGRAKNVRTAKMLKKYNYSGKWFIVVDTDDDQIELYKSNYGDEHIIVFNKDDIDGTFDIMDNFTGRQVPVYARNMLFPVAKSLNLKYFLELEDDYPNIRARKVDADGVLRSYYYKCFDDLIEPMIEFLETSGAVTVCWCQTGDLIGGKGSKVYREQVSRKAMQTFFCKVDNSFEFIGRFNDDVNMYVTLGMRGQLVMSIRNVSIDQECTQVNDGGIKAMYQKFGTYVKSFYSVMLHPSGVKIHTMGDRYTRIHHTVEHDHTYVKIISGRYKK